MMRGEKVTGGTVFSSDSPETYCAMANAGYDFIWTEMQHDSRDWETWPHVEGVSARQSGPRSARGQHR